MAVGDNDLSVVHERISCVLYMTSWVKDCAALILISLYTMKYLIPLGKLVQSLASLYFCDPVLTLTPVVPVPVLLPVLLEFPPTPLITHPRILPTMSSAV